MGALGAKTGPAIPYQWSPPSRLPRFLPALALLLLLLLKRNRSLQALWVAVPLVLSLTFLSLLWAILGIGSDAPEGVFETFSAVPIGLAAVWLLPPYLKGRGRFIGFLVVLAYMESFSLFACAIGRLRGGDSGTWEMLIGTAVVGLLLSVAINLAGWSCRARFGWRRLCLWLMLWLMTAWLAVFTVMSLLAGPGPLPEMATALMIISVATFGVLLPFLLLSFNNAFYRQRLKELLRLADAAPPSAAPPLPA